MLHDHDHDVKPCPECGRKLFYCEDLHDYYHRLGQCWLYKEHPDRFNKVAWVLIIVAALYFTWHILRAIF